MCEEIIALNVRDIPTRNDNFGTNILKKNSLCCIKLVVLWKLAKLEELIILCKAWRKNFKNSGKSILSSLESLAFGIGTTSINYPYAIATDFSDTHWS